MFSLQDSPIFIITHGPLDKWSESPYPSYLTCPVALPDRNGCGRTWSRYCRDCYLHSARRRQLSSLQCQCPQDRTVAFSERRLGVFYVHPLTETCGTHPPCPGRQFRPFAGASSSGDEKEASPAEALRWGRFRVQHSINMMRPHRTVTITSAKFGWNTFLRAQ